MRTLVVVPTYNEILNVAEMLRALREAVPECHVLVVDDASPDGTAARARELSSELGQIDVLERNTKSGLGRAYRAGFTWGLAQGFDFFVEIDCDFSHDPHALPGLLAAAREYEVVIGSRYVEGGQIPRWTWSRRMLSRGGNQYASVVLGLRVNDSTSGFRVYARSAGEDRLRDCARRRLRLSDRDDVPRAQPRRDDHRSADFLFGSPTRRVKDVERDRSGGAGSGHEVGD